MAAIHAGVIEDGFGGDVAIVKQGLGRETLCLILENLKTGVMVPKNGIYFCSEWHISPHIGICHFKFTP